MTICESEAGESQQRLEVIVEQICFHVKGANGNMKNVDET